MIKIENPAMSVNGADVVVYPMMNTRMVSSNVSPYWLANNIKAIAEGAPGGKLATLIINCHAFVDEKHALVGLDMGTGIYLKDLKHFAQLSGLVKKIHIPACGAAAGKVGRAFCKELAKVTKALVYAADALQSVGWSAVADVMNGKGLDPYEGQVFEFDGSSDPRPVSL